VTDCYFCEWLQRPPATAEPAVWEDDLVRAAHPLPDGRPALLGQVAIVLRRHTEHGLADLTDAEGQRIGLVVAAVSRALREVRGAAWTYTHAYTEGFRHVHQFVVARPPGLPPEYLRLDLPQWPDAPRGDADAVRALAAALRERVAASRRSVGLERGAA
jgi:histidine triad (HIT) family protein